MKKREIILKPGSSEPDRAQRNSNSLPAVPLWKGCLDWAVILVTSPVWMPAALFCWVWINLVSKGGALYTQERIGYGGKPFTIYKFRSMSKGADTNVHHQYLQELIANGRPMTKLDHDDSRLIRGGRYLRATGLDELPQLINVLKGEMSIVGPRPCTPAERNQYTPSYRKRFNGLPGITGSWQVNGKNKTTCRRMMALDIQYLRHQSIITDLVIMFRTGPAILGQVMESLKVKAAVARPVRPVTYTRNPSPIRQHATQIFHVAMNSAQPLAQAPSRHTERVRYQPNGE
jgi:lipopolysaccharide/colanic/teichoic acid biosynthesis glycosyltransferase